MMSNRGSRWLEPSSIIGILGFLSLVWNGYQEFRRDTVMEAARLSERIAVLEAEVRLYHGRGR